MWPFGILNNEIVTNVTIWNTEIVIHVTILNTEIVNHATHLEHWICDLFDYCEYCDQSNYCDQSDNCDHYDYCDHWWSLFENLKLWPNVTILNSKYLDIVTYVTIK